MAVLSKTRLWSAEEEEVLAWVVALVLEVSGLLPESPAAVLPDCFFFFFLKAFDYAKLLAEFCPEETI
jgi:hypothetical protein